MRFSLRSFKTEDANALVKHANNFNVSKNLTNKFPFPYTHKDAELFINFSLSQETILVKAIEIDGEVVGSIGIHPLTDIYGKNAELGYWIGEAFWGKGIVHLAINEMLRYGFKTFDIERIFARTSHTNTASQKAGFIFEAELKDTIFKFGEYYDELIFGFRKHQLI